MQMKLHRQFGLGLKDLTGQLTHPNLKQVNPSFDPAMNGGTVINGDGTETVNGYTLTPTSWESFPLCMVSGL